MPHQYDTNRWVIAADGSRTRVAGGSVSQDVDATDSASELAAAHGVDLSAVTGSGSGGRVTKADVEDYLEAEDDEDE